MPLSPGSSKATISKNISEMVQSGHPHRVAVAAALSNADRHPRHASGGGIKGYASGGGSSGSAGATPTSGSASGTMFGYSPQFSQLLGSTMGYSGFPSLSQTEAQQAVPTSGYTAPTPASANIAAPQINGASVPSFAALQAPQSVTMSNPFAGAATPSATGYGSGYNGLSAIGLTAGYQAPPPAPAAAPAPASSTPAAPTEAQLQAEYATGEANPDAPAGTVDYELYQNLTEGDAGSGGGGARGGNVGHGIKGQHYDTGGIMPGTTQPTSPTAANPAINSQIQQYASLPTEQLQQLSVMFGNSPNGQIINRVLQQKKMMPGSLQPKQAQPQQQQQTASSLNPAGIPTAASGGRQGESHYDDGGAVGYLHGETPGRTDVLHIQPPGGSYVIPADVVSGLGQGNSIAGAAILNRAFGMGPWNTQATEGRRGPGVSIPKPPPTYGQWQREFAGALPQATIPNNNGAPSARGGKAKSEKGVGVPTPIIAAAGEFIIKPDVVRDIGGGDMTRGHNVLDAWVLKKRAEINQEQRKLKPPKK